MILVTHSERLHSDGMACDPAQKRYLVIRVPTTGPRALIAEPNDFATEALARERIAAIEADHRMQHHTFLDIFPYVGDKLEALTVAGINY